MNPLPTVVGDAAWACCRKEDPVSRWIFQPEPGRGLALQKPPEARPVRQGKITGFTEEARCRPRLLPQEEPHRQEEVVLKIFPPQHRLGDEVDELQIPLDNPQVPIESQAQGP